MYDIKINLLIVEDDPYQQELLNLQAQQIEYVNIIGVAQTANELISQVTTNSQISALLLDIDLGQGRSGLESYSLLRLRGIDLPAVIITGSVPDATLSYDLGIVDVLEKPFTSFRFKQAIEKLKNHINYNYFVKQDGVLIPVVNDSIKQLPPSEVLFIESNNRCVYIQTINEKFETKISLKAYENYLNEHSFLLTHRSFLVNMKKIHYIEADIIHFWSSERTALFVEEKERELNFYLKKHKDQNACQ